MDSVIFVVRNVVMDASDDTVTPDAWISVRKYTRHRSNPHQETQIFSDPFDLRVMGDPTLRVGSPNQGAQRSGVLPAGQDVRSIELFCEA